jgi:hypothetical protein
LRIFIRRTSPVSKIRIAEPIVLAHKKLCTWKNGAKRWKLFTAMHLLLPKSPWNFARLTENGDIFNTRRMLTIKKKNIA